MEAAVAFLAAHASLTSAPIPRILCDDVRLAERAPRAWFDSLARLPQHVLAALPTLVLRAGDPEHPDARDLLVSLPEDLQEFLRTAHALAVSRTQPTVVESVAGMTSCQSHPSMPSTATSHFI